MNPVLKNVNDIIEKEIRYLSKFYTYNIEDFKDQDLLHTRSMLVFKDPGEELPEDLINRIINLMAGIELLATGLNLHTFRVQDFTEIACTGNATVESNRNKTGLKSEKPAENPSDKNYTVDLLFGDVLYARAVIYILKYGDFNIFNSILESLKSAHKSRLILHQELIKNLKKNGSESVDLDYTGVNSLLKTSFFIGWGIFSKEEKVKLPYEIISDFVSLKTLNDIGRFFDSFPEKSNLSEGESFTGEKCRSIKAGLISKTEDPAQGYIKENFKNLLNLY